jgi:hypothetical protein
MPGLFQDFSQWLGGVVVLSAPDEAVHQEGFSRLIGSRWPGAAVPGERLSLSTSNFQRLPE